MGFSSCVKLWQLKCVAVRETLREVYNGVYKYLPLGVDRFDSI